MNRRTVKCGGAGWMGQTSIKGWENNRRTVGGRQVEWSGQGGMIGWQCFRGRVCQWGEKRTRAVLMGGWQEVPRPVPR